jgi:hypothetical protein
VADEAGGYFRIFQPDTIGGTKGEFLDMLGKGVSPARRGKNLQIQNVPLKDVNKSAWQTETHFLIDERLGR